jgi:nucleotide-binding universal stress UspA family protein
MKVLLAIDEPSYANAIAEFVVTHKWEPDTEFEVMSVIEPLKVGSMMAVLPGPLLDEWMQERQENAERLVEDFVRRIDGFVPKTQIKKNIVEGFANHEIMKEITAKKPDMLVVGSHGRHGIDRIILGSVSLFLVSHAPCSVVVIRPQAEDCENRKVA